MELKEIETQKLLQMYANAKKTCSCGGHYKGERNDWLTDMYAMELRSRDVFVPRNLTEEFDKSFTTNVDIPVGIYGGEGSY